jgi:acetylornithine deacetylase/succinyl-diaminopimelate desuccinylase-like protein
MSIKTYIKANGDRFVDEWFSLLRIPSVSSQRAHAADMSACASRVASLLTSSGATSAEVIETAGAPIVYAERAGAPGAKTVLVYGHYDVMPPEPLELWTTSPFEPVIRDGYVCARGADDDKGQSMIQIKGFETALREDLLQANVKFLIEGEEEIGSHSLETFCRANRERLKADVILVSDTSMVNAETPSLTTGLRGLSYWEIEVTGPNRDLHSGHFGGAVANPINMLCQILSYISDDGGGHVTVPGFYDDVVELTDEEKAMLRAVPFDDEAYRRAINVKELFGEYGYSTLERNSCRPSFDICGIWGGYTGEGAKTVLPSKAFAKISCRLVPNQDHERITQLFIDYIHSIAPSCVDVRVTHHHGGAPYVCPIDLPAYRVAEQAFTVAFGKRPLAVRRGGSIPIIPTLESILGVKSVLMGFGLERNAIHSPNESFGLDMFFRGVEAVAEFYRAYH